MAAPPRLILAGAIVCVRSLDVVVPIKVVVVAERESSFVATTVYSFPASRLPTQVETLFIRACNLTSR